MPAAAPATARVLVVDDNSECRQALCAVVAAAGFVVVGSVASGRQALRLLMRTTPDLVLLDVRMPGLSGLETARLIRESGKDVAVVLVSAGDVHDRTSQSFDAKMRKSAVTPQWLTEFWSARAHRATA
jgi:CheY-like chemotaxis protein